MAPVPGSMIGERVSVVEAAGGPLGRHETDDLVVASSREGCATGSASWLDLIRARD